MDLSRFIEEAVAGAHILELSAPSKPRPANADVNEADLISIVAEASVEWARTREH